MHEALDWIPSTIETKEKELYNAVLPQHQANILLPFFFLQY
jgi:hypothetical protein